MTDIFKCFIFNEKFCSWFPISLKFIAKSAVNGVMIGLDNALLVNRQQIVSSTNVENDDDYMNWSAVIEQNMENTACR